MGRLWTMRIVALGGESSYLASVDDETGVWTVEPETYTQPDKVMALEELELVLSISDGWDDVIPGGFGHDSRHAQFALYWRPGSISLDVDPPYEYYPNVLY